MLRWRFSCQRLQPAGHAHQQSAMEGDSILRTNLLAAEAANAAVVIKGTVLIGDGDCLGRAYTGALSAAGANAASTNWPRDEEPFAQPGEKAGNKAERIELRYPEIVRSKDM